MSSLHDAARGDNPDAVPTILAQGLVEVNTRDKLARTPLIIAAWAGKVSGLTSNWRDPKGVRGRMNIETSWSHSKNTKTKERTHCTHGQCARDDSPFHAIKAHFRQEYDTCTSTPAISCTGSLKTRSLLLLLLQVNKISAVLSQSSGIDESFTQDLVHDPTSCSCSCHRTWCRC